MRSAEPQIVRKMALPLRSLVLALSLACGGIAQPYMASAQLCGNTVPLAQNTSLVSPVFVALAVSEDASLITAVNASEALNLDTSTLAHTDSVTLTDVGTAHIFESPAPPQAQYITQHNGYIEKLNASFGSDAGRPCETESSLCVSLLG